MVLHSHGCGGAERHVLLLMKALKQRGDAPVFAGPLDSWLGEQVKAEDIESVHLPMHGFYDFYSIARLSRLGGKLNADLLHGHLTRGAWYAGLAGKVAGLPVVATAHSTNAGKHFGRADRLIAVSEAVRQFLLSSGYDAKRISRIYHGVEDHFEMESQHRDAVRHELALGPNTIAVCIVARFVKAKGHDILFEALSRLKSDSRIHVFCLGDPETDFGREMRAKAANTLIENRITFLGHRESVYRTLAGMDVCVAPSRREALSLSLLEAASMGLPLIGSRTGGIPEVISDHFNGRLFPPGDSDALADLFRNISKNSNDWREMGRNSRKKYLEQFSMQAMVAQTLAVYQELQAR